MVEWKDLSAKLWGTKTPLTLGCPQKPILSQGLMDLLPNVFGDLDGIIIIPAELTLKVLEEAEKRFELETKVREDLKAGGAPLEVFQKYGVF